MQAGHKLSVDNFFKDLDRMCIHPEHADENLTKLLRIRRRRFLVDHIVYKQDLDPLYHNEPGFVFYLRHVNQGLKLESITIPYGPRIKEMIQTEYPERLYFRRKNREEKSIEEKFFEFQEEVWKAGL